jgi:flagellin-like protein
MNSKKGVSAVVATVLIIMITVAAVGIIWAAIIPMVRDNLNKGTACNDAMSDISLVTDGGYTCINRTAIGCPSGWSIVTGDNSKCNNASAVGNTGVNISSRVGNVSLQIKKGPNTKVSLVAVQALVFVGGNSETFTIRSGLPGNNEFKTVIVGSNTTVNATKVKIAPIVTVGKTEEVCEAVSEVTLPICS